MMDLKTLFNLVMQFLLNTRGVGDIIRGFTYILYGVGKGLNYVLSFLGLQIPEGLLGFVVLAGSIYLMYKSVKDIFKFFIYFAIFLIALSLIASVFH